MIWSPVPGLTAALEMVADNPVEVLRTSRAFRLDRSQRCAAPGIAGNAPSDARFFECGTFLRAGSCPAITATAHSWRYRGGPGRDLIVSVRSWNFTEAQIQRIAEEFQFSGDSRDMETWPANPAR